MNKQLTKEQEATVYRFYDSADELRAAVRAAFGDSKMRVGFWQCPYNAVKDAKGCVVKVSIRYSVHLPEFGIKKPLPKERAVTAANQPSPPVLRAVS